MLHSDYQVSESGVGRGPMGSEGRIDLPSVRLPADAAKVHM